MKKDILMLVLGLVLLVTGCFSGRTTGSDAVTGDRVDILPPAATAQVSIRLRLPDEALRAALGSATEGKAVFTLQLINRGNVTTPVALMRKTVTIVDGSATAAFQSVPAVPVIVSLDLENAGIYINGTRFQNFRGGADLIPGQNNEVVIVASGSTQPEDVLAGAASLAISDYTTMNSISSAVFAGLKEVFVAADAVDRLSAEKIFAAYKSRIVAAKIIAVTGGTTHSLALRDDGTLIGFGNNTYGQLGMPDRDESLYPRFSPFTRRVKAMAAGEDYSLLLCEDNKVYACGNNEMLQLGSSGAVSSAYPLEVPGLNNVAVIAAGTRHALAIDASGQLYAWGANDKGQLGFGPPSETGAAVQAVSGMTDIKAVAAGNNYSLLVKKDGSVWAAGDNSMLQLADATLEYSASFRQIVMPVTATSVAAGGGHCLALGTDGNVYAWGLNFPGQTGLATTTVVIPAPDKISGISGAEKVYAGSNHSMVVTSGGSVYVFGDNFNGQLGLALTIKSRNYPVLSPNMTAVSAIGCGAENSYSVSAGKGYAVGDNSSGQIGNGLTDETAATEGVSTPAEIVISSPWS